MAITPARGPSCTRFTFPNDASILRLVGALLLAPKDGRAVQRARCMRLKAIAPMGKLPVISLPALAS